MKKFNRKIGPEFNTAAQQKTHMDPRRAYRTLRKLLDRSIIEDARKFRQSGDGMTPAVLSVMEYKALRDATRLFGVRLKLLHEREEEKKVS